MSFTDFEIGILKGIQQIKCGFLDFLFPIFPSSGMGDGSGLPPQFCL